MKLDPETENVDVLWAASLWTVRFSNTHTHNCVSFVQMKIKLIVSCYSME